MDISSRLTQTITLQSQTGSDQYSDATWGAQRPVSARVEPSNRRLVSAQGTVVTATHRLFTIEPVLTTDRLWLPDGDTSDATKARRPADISEEVDLDGNTSHFEVTL
jgi:hypothetical protein